jgi:hypothetical protein
MVAAFYRGSTRHCLPTYYNLRRRLHAALTVLLSRCAYLLWAFPFQARHLRLPSRTNAYARAALLFLSAPRTARRPVHRLIRLRDKDGDNVLSLSGVVVVVTRAALWRCAPLLNDDLEL